MKTSFLLLLVCLSSVYANTAHSQNAKASINVRNSELEEVLNSIEKQTDYLFIFNDQVDVSQRVTVKAEKKAVAEILNQALSKTDIAYALEGKHIVLSKKEAGERANVAQQDDKKISGTIVDANGEAIIGASVVVKGTNIGTISDLDGNFSIQTSINSTLVLTYLGYLKQEIVVGNQKNLQVMMREDTQVLDEVVVVAYGTQKRKTVTGAMSKLATGEMSDMPVSNMGQKLQGKFAGVQINQANGEPNGGLSFRIRGQASINGGNSPLLVVDGFPTTAGLETISPDEIESITILKDAASASLYGSRAANGVILVTTKTGKEGKTNIEFSSYYGWEKVSDRGKPDVMNAQEFAHFKKEYYEDRARYEGYTGGVPDVYKYPDSVSNGTDWFDILLRTAKTESYNLSLTTGTNKMKSAVNINYSNQEGVVLNTYAERFSARANNLFKASEKVSFGLNLSGSYRKSQITGGLGGGRYIIGSSFLMDPQLKYRNDDGSYPVSYTQPGMFANANYYRVLTERQEPKREINAITNAFMDVDLIEGLKYRLSANVDVGNRISEVWRPSTANGGMFSAPPRPAIGSYETANYLNWLIENLFTYNKTIAEKHNLDFLAGYAAQKSASEHARINASQYPDDEISWFDAAAVKTGEGQLGNTEGVWSMISYIGRLNYNYNEKYLLSMSYRRDGCSRFGDNTKWANFPSVSLGWLASDENFGMSLKDAVSLNYLKVRASYGKVGNNNIGNYKYLASIVTSNYVSNGAIASGRALNGIGNNNLTWETTKQYNVGLDFGLFNDRLFFVYDYYWKNTEGLLYQIEIPRQAGFENIQSNIGEFRFWGHEFGLETKNFVGKDFRWSTHLNLTINRNKAIKLGTNDMHIGGNANYEDYNRTEVGGPLGRFYGYVLDGVFMNQAEFDAGAKHSTSTVGSVRLKDINQDGKIDMDDRTFIGDPNPDFVYGITNSFIYKDFDASIVIAGAVGGDIFDGTLQWTENLDGVFNVRKEMAERWRSEENPGNGIVPSTRSGTTEPFRYNTDRHVFDGSYLSVKNISLGYTLPLRKNGYISSARLYLSGQNLFTFTKYPGMNPEVSHNGSDGLRPGVDISSYPVSRIFTIGANIKF